MARPSAIAKALGKYADRQSALYMAMARPSTIDTFLGTFGTRLSAINKATAAMVRPSTIATALKVYADRQSTLYMAMARPATLDAAIGRYAAPQLAVEKAIKSFAKSSSLLLAEPNYVSELANTIALAGINDLGDLPLDEELSQSSKQLEEACDAGSFFKAFKNLPLWLQFLLYYLLIDVLLPQVNSISANLLTPIVESFLEDDNASERDKIKKIKKLPQSLENVDTDGLRFITGNNVRLRSEPSTNSEILDELVLGQVVTILSKNRNWIEVMYEYENGESISGWVFTRYTANFVK